MNNVGEMHADVELQSGRGQVFNSSKVLGRSTSLGNLSSHLSQASWLCSAEEKEQALKSSVFSLALPIVMAPEGTWVEEQRSVCFSSG